MRAALAERVVEPELLDGLDAADARAIASRRDLVRVNMLMRQAGIMSRLMLEAASAPPRRILEIGAGDGSFMQNVARRLAPRWPGVMLTLVDRKDVVSAERRDLIGGLGWRTEVVVGDASEWLAAAPAGRFDLITANLFLHHFGDAALGVMLGQAARLAPAFVATEPRRSRVSLAAASMLGAIGANDVSRHDARASVRGGFCGKELTALWPDRRGYRLAEKRAYPFTHVFTASRIA